MWLVELRSQPWMRLRCCVHPPLNELDQGCLLCLNLGHAAEWHVPTVPCQSGMVAKTGRLPFDLLGDLRIGGQDERAYVDHNIREGMVERCEKVVDVGSRIRQRAPRFT